MVVAVGVNARRGHHCEGVITKKVPEEEREKLMTPDVEVENDPGRGNVEAIRETTEGVGTLVSFRCRHCCG